MTQYGWRILIGSLLMVGGIVFLLENLDIVNLGDLFWGLLISAAGVVFVIYFVRNRQHWWALIPGLILVTIGSHEILSFAVQGFEDPYGGAYQLAGFGISFFAVYVAAPYNWWAIIPGGILLSLAGINLFDQIMVEDLNIGGGFFLGLGFTFLLVYILPTPNNRNSWAIFPALALLLLGVLVFITSEQVINYILPGVLIAVGLVLVVRTLIYSR